MEKNEVLKKVQELYKALDIADQWFKTHDESHKSWDKAVKRLYEIVNELKKLGEFYTEK